MQQHTHITIHTRYHHTHTHTCVPHHPTSPGPNPTTSTPGPKPNPPYTHKHWHYDPDFQNFQDFRNCKHVIATSMEVATTLFNLNMFWEIVETPLSCVMEMLELFWTFWKLLGCPWPCTRGYDWYGGHITVATIPPR